MGQLKPEQTPQGRAQIKVKNKKAKVIQAIGCQLLAFSKYRIQKLKTKKRKTKKANG